VEQLTELKAILHSKRSNIYYLDKCRVMQKGGRVVYITEKNKQKLYWNIPIANTTVLLLGTGTSITQAAVRMLASAGVLFGFCGGDGTPLLSSTEIEWLTPQSEYRPTEYVQGWMKFWFDDNKRLEVAKRLQKNRIEFLKDIWDKDGDLIKEGFTSNHPQIKTALDLLSNKIEKSADVTNLLLAEAQLTKTLYKFSSNIITKDDFVRAYDGIDTVNSFLNHGNYLAYGLAATTLWVLGIPHGFAVMHGKTRRGALVFDVADLIKDTLILPWAFICANDGMTEQEFRQQIILNFTKHKALDFMFETVKDISLNGHLL